MASRKRTPLSGLFDHLHPVAEAAPATPPEPTIERPILALITGGLAEPAPTPLPVDTVVVPFRPGEPDITVENNGDGTYWVLRVRHNRGSRDAVLYTRDELFALSDRIAMAIGEGRR